jgi:twitching motility two-component system response regulator PilH
MPGDSAPKDQSNQIRRETREPDKNFPIATILAVDDELSFLQFYETILATRGYRVLCAKSVDEAIDRLQSNSEIALVLCDIKMDEQDGFDLLTYIRNNLRFSQIPVIMCTSSSKLLDVVQCLKLGARDYIAKPIGGKMLVSKVEAVVASRGGRALLVSEDRYEADLIGRALRADGYIVTSMPSRQETIKVLAAETFSVAILRLALPDASGLDLMTEIKEKIPDLPVLIIRSWDAGLDDERVIAAGADGIIHRRFNNTEIAQQVKAAVQRRHRYPPVRLNITRRAIVPDSDSPPTV